MLATHPTTPFTLQGGTIPLSSRRHEKIAPSSSSCCCAAATNRSIFLLPQISLFIQITLLYFSGQTFEMMDMKRSQNIADHGGRW
eukprot:15366800-Ditylum_brightwellii.AAC.1